MSLQIGGIVRTQVAVNVRQAPTLTAAVVKVLPPDIDLRVIETQQGDGLTWWRTGWGWIAEQSPAGVLLLADAEIEDHFERALRFVLRWEGGLSTDENDPGNWVGGAVGKGALVGTKYGISAASYPGLDIPNLTVAQAGAIYRRDYWEPLGCDKLRASLALLHFDTGINMGKGAATTLWGQSGNNLLTYAALRLKQYASFGSFARYGAAWVGRVADLMEQVSYEIPL